jgi:membrane protein YqaA with SNARE-associated domain
MFKFTLPRLGATGFTLVAVMVGTVIGSAAGWVLGTIHPEAVINLNTAMGTSLSGTALGAMVGYLTGFIFTMAPSNYVD